MERIYKIIIAVTALYVLLLILHWILSPLPDAEEMWREYERVERLNWLW